MGVPDRLSRYSGWIVIVGRVLSPSTLCWFLARVVNQMSPNTLCVTLNTTPSGTLSAFPLRIAAAMFFQSLKS